MKTLFLSLMLAALAPTFAHADLTRSFSLPVQGERDASPAAAKLSYLAACKAEKAKLQASGLAPFVKSAACDEPFLHEGPTLFRAHGGLAVTLKRVMRVESERLATGFAENEEQAFALWNALCENFRATSGAPERVVFETCGQALVDHFYVKPAVKSVALRVETARVPQSRGEFCSCRVRSVEYSVDTPWGPKPRYRNVYDLMLLVEDGYWEKQATYPSSEECSDVVVKEPSCS